MPTAAAHPSKMSSIAARIKLLSGNTEIDSYPSVDAWRTRYVSRMRNAGFTNSEIDVFAEKTLSVHRDKHLIREQIAKQIVRNGRMPASRTQVFIDALAGNSSDELAVHLVRQLSSSRSLPIVLHADYPFARAARHYKYFATKSARIRDALHQFINAIIETARVGSSSRVPVSTQFIRDITTGCKDQEGLTAFIRSNPATAKFVAWAPANGFVAFYDGRHMKRCPVTNKIMPDPATYPYVGVTVIASLHGARQSCHPDVITDDLVRRDSVLQTYVLKSVGEWVTLNDGGQCVRELNEPRGAIELNAETGEWEILNGDGRVAGYHSAPRTWTSQRVAQQSIGVELELGFHDEAKFRRLLAKYVDSHGRFRSRPFAIESDSSVSSLPNGCEIISDPLPLDTGYTNEDSHWRWLLALLHQHGARGWQHRQYAGIHVNLDVRHVTRETVALFSCFINNAAAVSKFVSGRKGIYGGGGAIDAGTNEEMLDFDTYAKRNGIDGGHTSGYIKQETPSDLEAQYHTLRGRGKYQPVNIRNGNVVEVRIFGSNIKYEGFMACVEYCLAGMAFVQTDEGRNAVFASNVSEQFLAWLHAQEQYPNLRARLMRAEAKKASKVTVAQLAEAFSA